MKRLLKLATLAALACSLHQPAAAEIPPIPRVLPPQGLEIPAGVRERLENRLAATKKRLVEDGEELNPDVEVFTKAVELALYHREFYTPKDFGKADWALDEANKRLDSLKAGQKPWERATGLVVRGYLSSIDDSVQPYGLVVPKDYDFRKDAPLYVWLHGRGDKNTDLHFLYERATKSGQVVPKDAIVVHPFGRHCIGWKHAGEIDVRDVAGWVPAEYGLDSSRIVLIGFSMGGAGAWHIGAHYADDWVAVSPGAGFAETARYQRLTPERYPPWYEQKLWGVYDVPGYVRNLFNTNVIAYSGENDKQIQAARVMEDAYRAEGRTLTHLIGPGVEHKYEPKTLEELMRRLGDVASRGRDETPRQVHLQTQTLRYGSRAWVDIWQLEEHWKDARVDAEIVEPKHLKVTTKNVAALHLNPFPMKGAVISIDGIDLVADPPEDRPFVEFLVKRDGKWSLGKAATLDPKRPAKIPWQQGPIDDAFLAPFLVVVPTGKSKNAAFQEWMEFELAHFRDRWRALMRAELPVKKDVAITEGELDSGMNLILWGDSDSNVLLARLLKDTPLRFEDRKWRFGGQSYDGNRFVPACIFPRKLNDDDTYQGYVVLNSGLTFREGHDKTNSQQNPKLPDWAIIDITQPPDAFAPGRIHDAGFFDEAWKLKGQVKGP